MIIMGGGAHIPSDYAPDEFLNSVFLPPMKKSSRVGHKGQTPTGVNDLDIMRFSAPFMLFCPGGRTLEREREREREKKIFLRSLAHFCPR